MFYDHFLAVNWHNMLPFRLPAFASRVYSLLQRRQAELPAATERLLYYMAQQNWLVAYAEIEGIERALQGMARRTSFESGMERAATALRQDYALFQDEFQQFFPQLHHLRKPVPADGVSQGAFILAISYYGPYSLVDPLFLADQSLQRADAFFGKFPVLIWRFLENVLYSIRQIRSCPIGQSPYMIDHSRPVITKQYLGSITKHHHEGNIFHFHESWGMPTGQGVQ